MSRSRSPYRLSWLQILLISGGVALIFFAWEGMGTPPPASPAVATPILRRGDVLPTPTRDPKQTTRKIYFAGANLVAQIVPSPRTTVSWETRHLSDDVGLLEGTAWLDDPLGNIVLIGHVEDQLGRPGPFAYLTQAKTNDLIILTEGLREVHYTVASVQYVAPDDMSYVQPKGHSILTLITCADWDAKTNAYLKRLIVIAERVSTPLTPSPTPVKTASRR
jgi:LPXTG-site transpeptidase (sortase) family protein